MGPEIKIDKRRTPYTLAHTVAYYSIPPRAAAVAHARQYTHSHTHTHTQNRAPTIFGIYVCARAWGLSSVCDMSVQPNIASGIACLVGWLAGWLAHWLSAADLPFGDFHIYLYVRDAFTQFPAHAKRQMLLIRNARRIFWVQLERNERTTIWDAHWEWGDVRDVLKRRLRP